MLHQASGVAGAPPSILTTGEVALACGVSPETVRLWERTGKLQARKTARGLRLFDRHEVERLARQREIQSMGGTQDGDAPDIAAGDAGA